jgi:hypothetical protein
VAAGFPERSCSASSSRVRHSIILQPPSNANLIGRVSLDLIEIVMFLPPSLENCEICPLNWLVSYALKHVIFANGH